MDTNHVFSRHSQHCLLRWVHFGQHEIRIQYELPLYYSANAIPHSGGLILIAIFNLIFPGILKSPRTRTEKQCWCCWAVCPWRGPTPRWWRRSVEPARGSRARVPPCWWHPRRPRYTHTTKHTDHVIQKHKIKNITQRQCSNE